MEALRKSILSSEDVISLVEKITKDLSSHTYDTSTQDAIKDLCINLKHHGPSLESTHPVVLDNLQQVLRFACRDNNLDLVSRVYLLEIIELRALKWVPSDHVTNYYKKKLAQINGNFLEDPAKVTLEEPPKVTLEDPAKVTLEDPAKVTLEEPPKVTLEDPAKVTLEDPAKVTPPAASLQSKAKAANDSDLNVNAPEFTVSQSKDLREDVSSQMLPGPLAISLQQPPAGRKKASYGTEDCLKLSGNGMERHDVKTGIHTSTLKTVDGEVTISSSNIDLFYRAQDILKEKLAHQLLQENKENKSRKPELTYGRKELMELATSPLCSVPPFNWEKITSQVPDMVKSPAALDDTEKALADQPDHEKAMAGHEKAIAGHEKAVADQPDHEKAMAGQPEHAKRLRLQ